jgi:membrane associated rhomboid family serine protease
MPDRPLGRKPAPAWLRPFTERLSPTLRNLVVAESVLFGLYIMAAPLRDPIADHLALGPRVLAGELWQPLTSLFVHTELWNFFFSMVGLWFVGATIERIFGRRRFLLLFFATGLAANLVVAGFIVLLGMGVRNAGCGDSVLALFVALGVAYGRAPVRVWGQLVLQARVLAWIFVGMSVLSLVLQQAWPILAGTLVAQGLAYVLAGGKIGPIVQILASLRRKQRRVFQVLEGGRGKAGKKYVN